MPWPTHQLYKISKQFIDVEDFHSLTERGVKQEIYSHLLLINIARLFENSAKNMLPPPNNTDNNRESYWQGFFDGFNEMKINFKNCLLVVGRYIEQLLLGINKITIWLPNVISLISRVRQRIRPDRHYPRQSNKLVKKWAKIAKHA